MDESLVCPMTRLQLAELHSREWTRGVQKLTSQWQWLWSCKEPSPIDSLSRSHNSHQRRAIPVCIYDTKTNMSGLRNELRNGRRVRSLVPRYDPLDGQTAKTQALRLAPVPVQTCFSCCAKDEARNRRSRPQYRRQSSPVGQASS